MMLNIKNGLTAIANEILEDIEKEATKIILDAEKEAEGILQKAKEEGEEKAKAFQSEASEKGESEKKKMRSLTEIEIRNRILQVKDEQVNKVLDNALERLNNFVRSKDYPNYLLQLIEEAAKKIGYDNLIVTVRPEDKKLLNNSKLEDLSRRINVKLILSEEPGNYLGGCIVKTTDGKIGYDNTFEKRLQQLTPALRIKIAKILFEEEV